VKIGGGLRYVVGPMGSGKSLYGTRRMMDFLMAGKYVISNVRLYDDFAETAAKYITRTRPSKRQFVADKLKRYYIYETDLAEAIRYRVPGKGEGRALMVWDEAHNDLNNRSYLKRGKKYETEDGDGLLEWATQLRKLGYEGILLSQSHENTDAQLRRVCNYIVRLQNQRETVRVPLLNTRNLLVPPLFLAYWFMTNVPQGSKQKSIKVERYFLSWHKELYDTMDLYHGVEDSRVAGGVIRLPDGGVVSRPALVAAPLPDAAGQAG